MRELLLVSKSWVGSHNGNGNNGNGVKKLPADTTMTQLERAQRWLEFNSLEGISQQQAAEYAGVSVATMRRAIKARSQ